MRAKQKTTGINQIEVEHKGSTIVLVDVGGQRSERRKWFSLFDGVNTAIFLVALDEYDMVCEEDGQTNRLTESLTLWSEMTDLAIFRPPSWILFLNKWDLFEQKIKTKPLITSKYFKNSPTTEKDKKILEGDDPLESFQLMKKQYKKIIRVNNAHSIAISRVRSTPTPSIKYLNQFVINSSPKIYPSLALDYNIYINE